jgi:tRNA-specific 2-thiouridylase
VLTIDGKPLGEHAGQHRYTIGQRRGLGIAAADPLYVVSKDPATNTVTVGGADALLCASVEVGEANWLGPTPDDGSTVLVRYRAHGHECAARVTHLEDGDRPTPSGRPGRFTLHFAQPQRAIAPGQAAVLYDTDDADLVLGGGWIESALPA